MRNPASTSIPTGVINMDFLKSSSLNVATKPKPITTIVEGRVPNTPPIIPPVCSISLCVLAKDTLYYESNSNVENRVNPEGHIQPTVIDMQTKAPRKKAITALSQTSSCSPELMMMDSTGSSSSKPDYLVTSKELDPAIGRR
jgi:hypothetical protein